MNKLETKLTAKQEAFCLEYLATCNASAAYRKAYNAQNMKATTISRNAKALVDSSKIATRLDELRAPVRAAAGLTLARHLAALKRIRNKAEANKQFSAAVAAEIGRARAAGLLVEKVEVSEIQARVICYIPANGRD